MTHDPRSLPRAAILWLALAAAATAGAAAPPWRTWDDLHRLAELHPGHQALLRSSYCPGGCRFDRHSAGDWRYLYVDGEEGVIFEEAGAGAITRIWMTMGSGVSVPLDPEIRLRVYVDGAAVPVVDLPLPELFDGSAPPFVPPLVGDRETSSGGNFSYVPIPYRNGCRVALVGADEKRLWFQFSFHRLADAEGVASFTGAEDLGGLAALLAQPGQDPWPPASGAWLAGTAMVDPAAEEPLADDREPRLGDRPRVDARSGLVAGGRDPDGFRPAGDRADAAQRLLRHRPHRCAADPLAAGRPRRRRRSVLLFPDALLRAEPSSLW